MSQPQQIGRYEIVRRLGGGGMAEVFAARLVRPEGFSRAVALKRVLPGYAQDSSFAAMFIREAQLSAKFNHPNVVSVLDFDRDPEHGLFLAMEMVEGRDLSDLMKTGFLPIPIVIHLTTEILRGLGYAHNLPPDESGIRGVVHRDVSPHNVLLSWEGAVKVSDFGIAKARGSATSASASMMIKGKPAYMSPEQANGAKLDGRSDLFAVGVMLWEMLVGRPLFVGGTMHEMFAALFFGAIPSPHVERPEVPEDLAAVTLRLLGRQREQRYATAEDAVDALSACAAAPRDGRAALIDVLRERYPEHARSRPSRSIAVAEGTPTPEPLPPDAPTVLAQSASSGPDTPSAPSRRSGRLVAAFVVAGVVATALTAGIVRMVAQQTPNGPAKLAPGDLATPAPRGGGEEHRSHAPKAPTETPVAATPEEVPRLLPTSATTASHGAGPAKETPTIKTRAARIRGAQDHAAPLSRTSSATSTSEKSTPEQGKVVSFDEAPNLLKGN